MAGKNFFSKILAVSFLALISVCHAQASLNAEPEIIEEEPVLEFPDIDEIEQRLKNSVKFVEDPKLIETAGLMFDGEWDCFERNFVHPSLFYPVNYIDVGKQVLLPYFFDSNTHYGTFHYRVEGLYPEHKYGMILYQTFYSAAVFYCNGIEVASIGKVSRFQHGYKPAQRTRIVELKSDAEGIIDITVHISDYKMGKTGFAICPRMTSLPRLERMLFLNFACDIFIVGLMLCLFFYNLMIFIVNRKHYVYMFLSLISICIAICCLSSGFSILNYVFPDLSYGIEQRLGFVFGTLLVLLYFCYICGLYNFQIKRYLFIVIIQVLLILGSLFCPIRYIFSVFPFFAGFYIIFMIFVLTLIVRRIRKNSKIYLMNVPIIIAAILAGLYDLVLTPGFSFDMIKHFWIKLVVISFAIIQSAVIAFRRTYLYNKIRNISARIQDSNESAYRFLPREVLEILHVPVLSNFKLGKAQEIDAMILYANIHSFYSIAENLTGEETFKLLNAYYQTIVPIIRSYGGIIGKYLGDSITAFFPKKDDSVCRCAIRIQMELRSLRRNFRKNGLPDIFTGIGIHSGTIAVGLMGTDNRIDIGILSDSIRHAIDVEAQNKKFNADILVSEEAIPTCRSFTDCLFDGHTVYIRGQLEIVYSVLITKPIEDMSLPILDEGGVL